MQQTVSIATAIATRDETGFEGSGKVHTFAMSNRGNDVLTRDH